MAGRMQQRRSITASTVPTAGQLLQGELMININPADKKAYVKLSDDSVFELAGSSYALLASPALTGTPTAPTAAAGTNTTQLATTAFVGTAIGDFLDEVTYKEPVRVASTANIAIASALTNGSSIDGVTVATGDRVLLKDQSTASENGLYVVVASGAASRSTDADADAEVKTGLTVWVEEGTANGENRYTLNTPNPITVDTTALSFVKTSGSGSFTAGDGIDISTGVISVDVSDLVGTGIEDDGSNNFRLAAQGNGIAGGAGSTLSVQADSTGGANLATVANVSSNGVAIKIDDSTIGENGSNQLEVKNNSIDENKLTTSVAGNGLSGGNGTALSVTADSTGGANLATVANVSANGVAIKIDNATIVENGSNQLEVGTLDGGVI